MFDEALGASKYPTVQFKTSRVNATKISENLYRGMLMGDLNMHGNIREH